jgi:hypothetical protein
MQYHHMFFQTQKRQHCGQQGVIPSHIGQNHSIAIVVSKQSVPLGYQIEYLLYFMPIGKWALQNAIFFGQYTNVLTYKAGFIYVINYYLQNQFINSLIHSFHPPKYYCLGLG